VIERVSELFVRRLDQRRAGDIGSPTRARVAFSCRYGRRARSISVDESAAEAVQIDGAASEAAGHRRRDFLLRSVDVIAQKRKVTDARHGSEDLAERLLGIQARHEDLRAEGVADRARGHPQRPAGTQHEDRHARGHDGEEEHSEKELAH
jgi:hypothetical protein